MLKILLVYDDFQELTSVELMLKKIGFDVVGITSEFSLSEQLLSFNPQVVIAQGRTAKVSTASMGRRLRESVRWDGHSVLVFHPNSKPQPTELLKIRMDVGLEYPVEPTKLLQVLAQLGNLDANQLMDKLIKSMAQDAVNPATKENAAPTKTEGKESVFVSGGKGQAETHRGVGGAAASSAVENQSSSKGAALSKTPEQVSKANLNTPLDAKNLSGGSSGSEPLFPLENKKEKPDAAKDRNASGSSGKDDPLGVTGTFGINPFQMDQMTKDPLMQELENLLQKKPELTLAPPPLQDPARRRHYDEYMKTIPISDMSSIKRTEAKRRLKDLIKDIDRSELSDQDVLRREFVNALFKKEG